MEILMEPPDFSELTPILNSLASKFQEINEIWLIGSRAERRERDDSDWDILIFGEENVVQGMAAMLEFKIPSLDFLVVYDGNNFRSPYFEKSGSLSSWKWQRQSENYCYYRGQGTYDPESQSWTREGLNVGFRIWNR